MSALWPHLFTPMPSHKATTWQHRLVLLGIWSVPAPPPDSPGTSVHMPACLLSQPSVRVRMLVHSHVYPSPKPLHGGGHVCLCLHLLCPSVLYHLFKSLWCQSTMYWWHRHCLHLCLVLVLPYSGVDILVDMFMSQGHHMAVQACQFLPLPCPGKAFGEHENLCLYLLHPHLVIQHACSCTCCVLVLTCGVRGRSGYTSANLEVPCSSRATHAHLGVIS